MFDDLTFRPACDDRSIVRFSTNTNNLTVTAATPPRLVAEITSPKFMDYDLVSDFFLTYRSFIDPSSLLRLLVARLRWAIARSDEVGMVVRVRTFVALRHWILNYFMDDFVIDYYLRVLFCDLINLFVDELLQDPSHRKVQLKIVTELKKCWRRSCAQYWDGDEFNDNYGPERPITAGGIAGHRNPTLDPSFWQQQMAFGDGNDVLAQFLSTQQMAGPQGLPGLPGPSGPLVLPEPPEENDDEIVHPTGNIDSMILGDEQPTITTAGSQAEMMRRRRDRRQASPTSMASVDFVSCSFPTKSLRLGQDGMAFPMAAHPAEPGLLYNGTGAIATTPRALVGKRVRPSQETATASHKRNNSLTDSLRDYPPTTADKLLQSNPDLLCNVPYAGSLVRGAVFPPSQPYVEILPFGVDGAPNRQTTLFEPDQETISESQKEKASAMSGQGMRKLLGSVRRALSTKGQTVSPTQGNFINISPIGPRGATTNRLPGTAIVPQARPRLNGIRAPVRLDLLGAKISEDFKTAVREEALQEESANLADLHAGQGSGGGASAYSDSLLLGIQPPRDLMVRPSSDAGITTGSKSIVIVDGTMPVDFPVMAGALPGINSSVDAFDEAFLSRAADPTPPATPPGRDIGTPRRSSHILGHHALRISHSAEPLPVPLPPFSLHEEEMVGMDSVSEPVKHIMDTSLLPSSDVIEPEFQEPDASLPRPSMDDATVDYGYGHGLQRYSSSIATSSFMRRIPSTHIASHARQISSRSFRSNLSSSHRSFGHRRFASFASGNGNGNGLTPQVTVRSIDESTLSEMTVDAAPAPVEEVAAQAEAEAEADTEQPAHVLRRRPGGDLRAVANVADANPALFLRRSRSLASLTTYSDSIRSSYICSLGGARGTLVSNANSIVAGPSTKEQPQARKEVFSLGMMTEKAPKRQMSLFSTHSSKPVMRPSFEAVAQKLAQIPDDAGDDGGVESALLKLEGKYEKKKPHRLSIDLAPPTPTEAPLSEVLYKNDNDNGNGDEATWSEKHQHRFLHVAEAEVGTSTNSFVSGDTALMSGALDSATEPAAQPVAETGVREVMEDIRDDVSSTVPSYAPAFSPPPAHRPAAVPRMADDVQSFLSEESGESYSSIPLLDRGLTDDGRSRICTTDQWANHSIFQGDEDAATSVQAGSIRDLSGQSSYEMVQKTESIEQIRPGETMPQSPGPRPDTQMSSFLEDDSDGDSDNDDDHSDNDSDLSSEMSAEVVEEDDNIYGPIQQRPERSNTVASRLPAHPLGDPETEPGRPVFAQPVEVASAADVERNGPPSPPMTLVQALQMSPETARIPEVHDHQLWGEKPLPATPATGAVAGAVTGAGPGAGLGARAGSVSTKKLSSQSELPNLATTTSSNGTKSIAPEVSRKFSVHLPFILAFDSDVLAQQFTLIEKDALHEIDWKELIEMRWKDAENSNVRSWVDFLRSTDARGVEVVIARFNIMVKWTISEVVLTQDIEERARCLIKFIHIAAHCRQYRNYATMSQITIALTSNEVNRLTKTWHLVPSSDIATLRGLEALVSPTRNFYTLRAEMEAVDISNADTGCIPFVGIYTHDLLFNAQRPSEIASSPTTPPLVNFERCRCAASVVKTLLRLVEASALYTFQPIEGVTERCLWMSALSDDNIRKNSEALE